MPRKSARSKKPHRFNINAVPNTNISMTTGVVEMHNGKMIVNDVLNKTLHDGVMKIEGVVDGHKIKETKRIKGGTRNRRRAKRNTYRFAR